MFFLWGGELHGYIQVLASSSSWYEFTGGRRAKGAGEEEKRGRKRKAERMVMFHHTKKELFF
jgi:hypothetical protein